MQKARKKSDVVAYQKCAGQHFGPWSIEPKWFTDMVQQVKAGNAEMMAAGGVGERQTTPRIIAGNIAKIDIAGQTTKGESSFGGTSTVNVRHMLRNAVADEDVKAILLHIDSPGGTVAGNADLADDIKHANAQKPVYAHIDDLGASAGYYAASQTRRITANRTAMVGSIGTVAVLYDTSGAMEKAGVKVHVLSTGEHKGAFTPGAEIKQSQIDAYQNLIDQFGNQFIDDVTAGRGVDRKTVEGWATGQVWLAEDAREMGLIDSVNTLDETIQQIQGDLQTMNEQDIQAFLESHPDTVNAIKEGAVAEARESFDATIADKIDEARAEGYDAGMNDEKARVAALVEKFGERPSFVVAQAVAGHDTAKASQELAEELLAENKALKEAQAGGTKTDDDEIGVGFVASDNGGSVEDNTETDPDKIWDQNINNVQAGYFKKGDFIAAWKRDHKN